MTIVRPIRDSAKEMYGAIYPDHIPIGWILDPESNFTKLLLRSKRGCKPRTPYQTARDCGDHYIIARYDRYDSIDKETGELTHDVEDR